MPPRFTQDLTSAPAQPPRPEPIPQVKPLPISAQPVAAPLPASSGAMPPVSPWPVSAARPKRAKSVLPAPPTFGGSTNATANRPTATAATPYVLPAPGPRPVVAPKTPPQSRPMSIVPNAPPVFGAPAAFARTPTGTLASVPSIAFPVPQRVLRPRTRLPETAKKSFVARLNKKLVLIVAGVLVLLSGAGAYFFWFGPASEPRAVFAASLANAMSVKYYHQTYTLDRKIGNSAIHASYASDVNVSNADKPVASGTLNVSQSANDVVSTREGEFVLIAANQQYIRLKSFTDENISGTAKGIDQAGQTLLTQVKDKWLITDESSTNLPLSALILLNPLQLASMNSVNGILLIGNIDPAKQKALVDFNNAQAVYSIGSAKAMSFQGHNAYRYDVNIKKDKLQEYNQLFNSHVLESSILTSIDGFTYYVDAVSRLPMRIEVQQNDLTIVVDYSNYGKAVEVAAPKGAQKIDDAVPGGTGDGKGGSLELQGTAPK